MTRHSLTFDEATHTYGLDGKRIPSVTQVIGAVWPELWEFCGDFAKERGRVVHKAIHYAIKGTLDWDSLDPFLTGYVTAATRALRELDIEVEGTEERVYSVLHRYAGTMDVHGERNGRFVIADFKTGDPGLSCGLQLAAYTEAFAEMHNNRRARDRFGIWIHEDGTFDVKSYTSRDDWSYFLAARTVYDWPGGKIANRNNQEEAAA